MITLKSNRLRVEVALPGHMPNTTTRFNRAGFISEVILDEDFRFCASEPRNLNHETSGGRGLCCEYTADLSGDCQDGTHYPKLGVGLIPIEHTPYHFWGRYEGIDAFEVEWGATDDQIMFRTIAKPCEGYAVEEVKIVTVKNNQIFMETQIMNVGTKAIDTEEYCHNFLSLDGMALGRDYELMLPIIKQQPRRRLMNCNDERGCFCGIPGGVGFCEMAAVASMLIFPDEEINKEINASWTMYHHGAGISVSEEDSFPASWVGIWATDHILSPEIKHRISIKPGEKDTFTRCWTFDMI